MSFFSHTQRRIVVRKNVGERLFARTALPPCCDPATWQMYNSLSKEGEQTSPVHISWGLAFSTDRFRPDGLKETCRSWQNTAWRCLLHESTSPTFHHRQMILTWFASMMQQARRANIVRNTLRDPSEMVVAVCGDGSPT
jgi:hypothetical protein